MKKNVMDVKDNKNDTRGKRKINEKNVTDAKESKNDTREMRKSKLMEESRRK